jgi:hypothetical protein
MHLLLDVVLFFAGTSVLIWSFWPPLPYHYWRDKWAKWTKR